MLCYSTIFYTFKIIFVIRNDKRFLTFIVDPFINPKRAFFLNGGSRSN